MTVAFVQEEFQEILQTMIRIVTASALVPLLLIHVVNVPVEPPYILRIVI